MKVEMTKADLRWVCEELVSALTMEMHVEAEDRMNYPEITAEWRRQAASRDASLKNPKYPRLDSPAFCRRNWRALDKEANLLDRMAAQLGPRKVA